MLGTDAAHVHGGLLATLTSLGGAEPHSPTQGVPVGTIKRTPPAGAMPESRT